MTVNPYLDAVRQRVVIFDGATGTNLQLRHLGPDDFGGPHMEGCNELLVDTRPDVVADLHRSFLAVASIRTGAGPYEFAATSIVHQVTENLERKCRQVIFPFWIS